MDEDLVLEWLSTSSSEIIVDIPANFTSTLSSCFLGTNSSQNSDGNLSYIEYNLVNLTANISSENLTLDMPYFGSSLHKFQQFYLPIHGYLSLSVCIFGIISNLINIIVLTRYD